MEESKDLGKLTIYQIFESILGDTKAKELLESIQNGIKSGATEEELKELIYHALCEANVTDIRIFEICNVLPQVITGPKAMAAPPQVITT